MFDCIVRNFHCVEHVIMVTSISLQKSARSFSSFLSHEWSKELKNEMTWQWHKMKTSSCGSFIPVYFPKGIHAWWMILWKNDMNWIRQLKYTYIVLVVMINCKTQDQMTERCPSPSALLPHALLQFTMYPCRWLGCQTWDIFAQISTYNDRPHSKRVKAK